MPSGSPVDISRDRTRIRSMFSRIAPRYDLGNHLLSANIDRLWRRYAARRALAGVDACAPLKVLDCCCGTADLALAFRRRMKADDSVVGSDFAVPMLSVARRKSLAEGPSDRDRRIDLAAADALSLPFRNDLFDIVTVAFGLRNLVDRNAGLVEMTRVCRPGGRVMVLEFTTPPNPLIRACYLLYFKRLLPMVARVATGSREYAYLPASVAEFPPPDDLTSMMREAGLRAVEYDLLTAGIAALHIGVKP